MGKLNKIAIGYLSSGSDNQVVVTVDSGLQGIAATFTAPTPPLATVQTALDEFVDAMAVAVTGGVAQTAARNEKREVLAGLVRQLSNFVTTTADGDLAMLLASGLPVQNSSRTRIGPLPTPRTPAVQRGATTGVLNTTTAPINGAGVYNWRVALASAPSTYLQTKQTVGARTIFGELTPGEVYNVDVSAVGAAGATDWSNTASTMVV